MSLTRTQFDVLEALAVSREPLTQRQLESITRHPLETVNRVTKELTEVGYVANATITDDGLNVLEPYRAKRAVFIAAGCGTRLAPITLNTPKPLVRVHGVRIIDRLIDACLEADIHEIYVVRGYLSELFDQLLYKYPMVKFLAIKKSETDDWCFKVRDGVIVEEKKGGVGDDIWQMVGVSYWNEADGHKLSQDIADAYASPGGKELYWEQAPLVYRKGRYAVEVRECRDEDIVEIDTFKELKAIDKIYDV